MAEAGHTQFRFHDIRDVLPSTGDDLYLGLFFWGRKIRPTISPFRGKKIWRNIHLQISKHDQLPTHSVA